MNSLKQSYCVTALLLLFCAPAWAINKCTGADGKLNYQDLPCDAKSKTSEQLRIFETRAPGRSVNSVPDLTPDMNLVGSPQAKQLLDFYRRWADAERLAFATGRIALSGPVAAMQALAREAEAMTAPACLESARKPLVELAKKSRDAILEFLGKDAFGGMVYQIAERRKLIPEFESAIKTAKCD